MINNFDASVGNTSTKLHKFTFSGITNLSWYTSSFILKADSSKNLIGFSDTILTFHQRNGPSYHCVTLTDESANSDGTAASINNDFNVIDTTTAS